MIYDCKVTQNPANCFLFAVKSAKRRAKVLRFVTFARLMSSAMLTIYDSPTTLQ